MLEDMAAEYLDKFCERRYSFKKDYARELENFEHPTPYFTGQAEQWIIEAGNDLNRQKNDQILAIFKTVDSVFEAIQGGCTFYQTVPPTLQMRLDSTEVLFFEEGYLGFPKRPETVEDEIYWELIGRH